MKRFALFLFSSFWVHYGTYDTLEECRYYEIRIQQERPVEGLCLEIVGEVKADG